MGALSKPMNESYRYCTFIQVELTIFSLASEFVRSGEGRLESTLENLMFFSLNKQHLPLRKCYDFRLLHCTCMATFPSCTLPLVWPLAMHAVIRAIPL